MASRFEEAGVVKLGYSTIRAIIEYFGYLVCLWKISDFNFDEYG